MSAFTTDKPGTPGLWEFVCMETDGKPERCAITEFEGDFTVHSEHLSETPLDYFHNGLTQIRWRKIA